MRIGLFNDTSLTRHHGCTAVMTALLDGLAMRGATVMWRWPVAVDWQPHAGELAARPIDAVLINGEGSIHHSATRPRAGQLCAIGRFARDVLGKPGFLLNATVEDLDAPAIDNLRAFTAISVRETASRDYLARHGISATVAGDFSFSARMPPAAAERHGILMTDSVLRDSRKALLRASQALRADWLPMQRRAPLIERLRRRFGATSPLLTNATLDPSLAAALSAFLSRLAKAEAVVTGRFHTVCMALATQTPVLALGSNTPKIASILTDATGDAKRLLREPLDPVDVKVRLADAAYSEEDSEHIHRYILNCRQIQSRLLDIIAAGGVPEPPS